MEAAEDTGEFLPAEGGLIDRPPARRFMFWCLLPWLLAFLILMPLLIPWSFRSLAIIASLEIMAALLLIGLYDSVRFGWALRFVAFMVFLAYVAYLVAMLIESGGQIEFTWRRAKSSAFNAILGLFMIGLPALGYALQGRWAWPRRHNKNELHHLPDQTHHQPD